MHAYAAYSLPDFPGGKFPEHLLPCAAPLLAALTKAASSAGAASLNLADQICGAMAANTELQEKGGYKGWCCDAPPPFFEVAVCVMS